MALANWTDQGIRDVKETIKRSDDVRALASSMNVEITALYWTQGPYDLVIVLEAPDDEAASAFSLAAGSRG